MRQLIYIHGIRALLSTLGRFKRLCRRTLRTTPTSLADEEALTGRSAVDFAGLLVDDDCFRLDDCSGLALVVYAEHLGPQLEGLACGCGREWLQELELALAIDDTACVEFWDAGDGVGCLCGVEVDYFLGCAFECCRLG